MALFKHRRPALVCFRSSFSASFCSAVVNQISPLNDNDPVFGTRRSEADDFEDDETDTEDLYPLAEERKVNDDIIFASASFSSRDPGACSCGVTENNTHPKWKKLVGPECGIYHGHIPQSAWMVLQKLKDKGFTSYLVGGCLRDALLKQIPKDYDVITTADLQEVKSSFHRSMIVGRHFPVCHVVSFGNMVEVSSFSTVAAAPGKRPKYLKFNAQEFLSKEDMFRCENTMNRDFTVNAFMYDPFERVLYDYVGGLADLEKRKVRTIVPPHESFTEDPARLLRGIRIAARLGFRFSRETSKSVKALKSYLMTINQARLMQELNTMMSYGAAAASLRLLWKYEYLEVLLPAQAAYLERTKLKKSSKARQNLLTDLLTVLDKFVSPDKPCHTSLWIAVLALQLALEEKRSHIGVLAALLAIRHQNMNVALRDISKVEALLKGGHMIINEAYIERSIDIDEDNTIVAEALHIIDDAVAGLQRMHGNPEDEPSAYGTLISRTMYAKVLKLFQGARDRVRKESLYHRRSTSEYLRNRAFVDGADAEVVYALSCIFLNTLFISTDKTQFLFR